MLKNAGTISALPMALSCSDFAIVTMRIDRPSVQPEPPMMTNALLYSPAHTAAPPSALTTRLAIAMAVSEEVTMVAPWMPTSHRAWIRK